MLTPCKSVETRQDDLSADEDMLENTKPNLISFSLSTSSSNYTVSATTNSSQRDVEVESFPRHQLSSFEPFRPSGEIKLPISIMSLTSPTADPPATILSSCSDSSANANLFTEETFTKCSKTDIFLENSSVKNNNAIAHSGVRSSSMCSLYENPLRHDMPRFASHPQLNAHLESKRSILTRSLSSITLKHRSHAYDHVESKVKHYIKQLKKEKAVASEPEEEPEVNFPFSKEDSVVIQLQQEVEKLQNYLEERDLLLQEVQANYHSLLLQYGEAKNKLDQLRFTSVAPEKAAKSVQTQSHLKADHETSFFGPYKTDELLVLENVHESENQISSPNKSTLSIIKDEKGQKEYINICQNTEVSNADNFKLDFEVKDSNGLSEEKSTSYSPDMAALKVSSWFSSLPWQLLPVPSCYGSLGSSGSISNQQLDCAPTDCMDKNEDEKLAGSSEQLWMKNCNLRDKPLEDHGMTVAEGENLCFPPMEKCHCWTPNNIQDCPILEGKPCVESVEAEMNNDPLEALCVPPLDLELLNNTLPQDSSVSKTLFLSEDSLSSLCSQQSSFDEKCSFKQTRVSNQMYLETPTSYKSIAINPGRAVEAKAGDKSSVLVSLSRDQQSCRKNDHYLKSSNSKSNRMEDNWEKVNDQRPCCLKKIMQRCCIDDIHVCYHWTKTPNHQLLRCEQCPSRDSKIPSDSQILHNLEQCLGNMSVCAEGLRKRSEAIESFLTNLLDSHS